jgi:hypothetical protein
MYRILQALEREPTAGAGKGAAPVETAEKSEGGEGVDGGDKSSTRRSNPHKYLLYRPTFAQLMLYIATAFKVLSFVFF